MKPKPIDPLSARLDASTICNLRCPTCPTTQGKVGRGAPGSGYLRLSDFQKFVDANPRVLHVELSNWGEIFMNPDIEKIIACAFSKSIALTANNGVNFSSVPEPVLEALVRYRFRSLSCSIDGATEETYRMYRRGGSLDQVLKNIRAINAHKQKYKTDFPILIWRLIVFGHNEHEIPEVKRLAAELGMSVHFKLAWDDNRYSPLKDPEFVKAETGLEVTSLSEYHALHGEVYLQRVICSQMWNSPQINWDGKMLGCCENYWGDYGNVFEEGLAEVLNGEKMNYARKMLTGQAPARKDIPCTSCPYYHSMLKDGRWLALDSKEKVAGAARSKPRI